MLKSEILAVAKVHPLYLKALKEVFVVHDCAHEADAAGFAQLAPRILGLAAGGESLVPSALLEQLPNLKLVSVFGVGYDGIDVQAAVGRGVMVTHTPGVLTDDVADLALGLMLSLSRNIAQADHYVRAGRWPTGPMPLGRKFSGARLGIVGLGRIGMAIAQRALAFKMSIAYTGRSEKPGSGFVFYPTVAQLAAEVDFLLVITPGGQGTRHLVNAEVLAALGPAGYLINVARGSVVDEQALIEALQSGAIAGAALDVFADEPNVPQVLRDMPNLVLTPHMASATHQTRQAMADLAFANMEAVLAGRPALTPVPECLAAQHPRR